MLVTVISTVPAPTAVITPSLTVAILSSPLVQITVLSKAFSGSREISEEKRHAIFQIAKEQGYRFIALINNDTLVMSEHICRWS